ncbi:hypothetical protein LIA77_06792 [Sarocladium implicatum]|nr:hypothetical protein LIA77_06792 [Sarocladium implicatum]
MWSITARALFFVVLGGTIPTSRAAGAEQPEPVRLSDVGQCPMTPKPSCPDPFCGGSHWITPDQYRCTNQTPTLLDVSGTGESIESSTPVILAGCWCCPLPDNVSCHNYPCRAPEGSRVCIGEMLEGCACLTREDQIRLFNEAVAEEGGPFTPVAYWEDWIDEDIDYPIGEDGHMIVTGSHTPETSTSLVSPALETMRLVGKLDCLGV